MNTTRRRLIAAAALACAGTALAADFPAGTVRLVHGIPGGAVDAGVRVLAEQLGPKWGQTPLVEGKPGASEMLAAAVGWGWLLALHAEAARHDAPWAGALGPLALRFAAMFADHLPRLTYPITVGTHYNTAFALALALGWAE